ncbi:MAG: ribosome biogenesis GTPase Der [Patescibacteria group bacterium]
MKNTLPRVAIVGRANVGKSTLFNRLIEKNKALVSEIAGTTRDRNIDVVKWQGNQFTLIDTGGLDIDKTIEAKIGQNIVKQAERGIKDAELILFLVDIKNGIIPTDKTLAKKLLQQNLKAKIIFVANKADSLKLRQLPKEVFSLGLGEPFMISAANGSGTGDLLDLIIGRLPLQSKNIGDQDATPTIKLALVGRPNVGKSSILNSILGEERVMVTDIPHTTREAHDTEFDYKDHRFVIIDTAGIRKQNKIKKGTLEKKSIGKSLEAIGEADVVVLVTEVQKSIDVQDKKITQQILERGKSVIIVANKWDLVASKDTNTINDYVKYYQGSFPYLWWAPLIFVSAKENLRTKKILDLILDIKKSRELEISDSQLERFLKSKIKQHRPSRGQGLKNPFIYDIKQVKTNPPRFIITVNDPKILHFSYIRFLQNNLRETFKIIGTPIQIEVKKKKEKDS